VTPGISSLSGARDRCNEGDESSGQHWPIVALALAWSRGPISPESQHWTPIVVTWRMSNLAFCRSRYLRENVTQKGYRERKHHMYICLNDSVNFSA